MADQAHATNPEGKKPESQQAGTAKPPTSWVIPVIAGLILASAFCLYYFVYVKARREYLANRNFRALAVLGDQLQKRISIHGSILNFYVDLEEEKKVQKKIRGRAKLPLEQFLVVHPEDKALPTAEQGIEARKDYLKFLSPIFELREKQASSKRVGLQVLRQNGQWELVLHNKSYRGSFRLDELLNPLVRSLPFDDILLVSPDGTIVYQSIKAGPQFTTLTDLLQAQAGGGEKTPADSSSGITLSPKTQSEPASGSQGPEPISLNADRVWRTRSMHLTDILLAGTPYKLFVQPIVIDVSSGDAGKAESPHEWVVCGLKAATALEWEALSLSYSLIVWLTAAFLAICMSGPVLKVLFMNHRERLRLLELAILGLFLVLLTGVFTLSGVQAVFLLNDDTEDQLKRLGNDFARQIYDDLRDMRHQLKTWCETPDLWRDLNQVAHGGTEVIRHTCRRGAVEKTDDLTPETNQYINNVFWTDDDGHQIVKWSASQQVTPMIDVSQQPIFTHPKTAYLDGKGTPFYFDSILPPNKLDYLAALAMKTEECNPALKGSVSVRGSQRDDVTGGVAVLAGQPLSLIDPILPYGYGFALIDQTGRVLFHVDKTRNTLENFRQEADWSQELYAATFGHSDEKSLTVQYMGRPHRVRVLPIPGVSGAPLSLIVYQDLGPVRTINLQVMTMASTSFLLLLAGPIVIFFVWCAVTRPRFAPEWIWPNQHRKGTYLYQIGLYTFLIVLFLFLGTVGSSEEILIACAIIPYTALLLTLWCFQLLQPLASHTRNARQFPTSLVAVSVLGAAAILVMLVLQWRHVKGLTFVTGFCIIAALPLLEEPRRYLIGRLSQRDKGAAANQGLFAYRNCYVFSVLLLLLLIGVMTPMMLVRASHGVETRLAIKQAQLHLASALDRRRTLIEDQCEHDATVPACSTLLPGNKEDWHKIAPLAEWKFDTCPRASGSPRADDRPTEGEEFYSPWFRRLTYWLHHDYNDAAAEMLGVIPDRAVEARSKYSAHKPAAETLGVIPDHADPDWLWVERGSEISLRWHGVRAGKQPELAEDDVWIKSKVPPIPSSAIFGLIAVAASVMLVIGILCWALARKIFLLDVSPLKITGLHQVVESISEGKNVLILAPQASPWKLEEAKWTLDLPKLATEPKWAENLDLNTIPFHTVIEIRGFEQTMGNIEIDNQKFVLLQRLMKREKTQLAVIMTVPASLVDYRGAFPGLEVIDLREEPIHWLHLYKGPAQDLIWKECGPMAALWPIGAQLARDINAETARSQEDIHSQETIASEILERADPYYRLIWNECSKEQKFVLAQLAEDGLPNPANGRAIRQMVRRGLITKDPQFRIMNESFRCFLRSATTTRLKQDWVLEARRTGWGKMHGAFLTGITLVGAFLLVTQNALWQSSAAYVTTALGALSTLAKFAKTFRDTATPEKAD